MIDKEVRELRRRFQPDHCNSTAVVGCFINSNKQIIYRINQSLAISDSTISEKLLMTFRKVLSGSIGTTLHNVDFSTKQAESSEQHKLLTALRSSRLNDKEAVSSFFTKVSESLNIDGNYVILLIHDTYDVPTHHSDGENAESSQVFSYITCAICPVKEPPETVTFREADALFHINGSQGILSSPEVGFVFPAFDDRQTNIYGALYYTKSKSNSYGDFTRAIFDREAPLTRTYQKNTFSENLSSSLGEECDLKLVRTVSESIDQLVKNHKESRTPEALTVTKYTISTLLENAGISAEKISCFADNMDKTFGKGAEVSPKNLLNYNKFEISMPEVKITTSPEVASMVKTKVINGEKYVLIKVTGEVEINGIKIHTDENKTAD